MMIVVNLILNIFTCVYLFTHTFLPVSVYLLTHFFVNLMELYATVTQVRGLASCLTSFNHPFSTYIFLIYLLIFSFYNTNNSSATVVHWSSLKLMCLSRPSWHVTILNRNIYTWNFEYQNHLMCIFYFQRYPTEFEETMCSFFLKEHWPRSYFYKSCRTFAQ